MTMDSAKDLQELVHVLKPLGVQRTLGAGETLITQGRHEQQIYILLAGSLRVVRDGVGIRELSALDLVGEYAFLDNRPRTAAVEAIDAVEVLELDRQALLLSGETDMGVVSRFLAIATDRMNSRELEAQTSQISGFLDGCTREALNHRAVQHPYLQAMASCELPDINWALADFGRHYSGYSAHFPRYLTQTISQLSKAEHRRSLMENLLEEQGTYAEEDLEELARVGIEREWIVGVPHPELFKRFCDALAVRLGMADQDSSTVVCWREMFLDVLGQGSPAQAVGALGLGTEGLVSTMYQNFLPALKQSGLSGREGVFFPLHATVDDHHQEALNAIARDFADTAEGRLELKKGMRKALFLRTGFWDWMYARALDPENAADDTL